MLVMEDYPRFGEYMRWLGRIERQRLPEQRQRERLKLLAQRRHVQLQRLALLAARGDREVPPRGAVGFVFFCVGGAGGPLVVVGPLFFVCLGGCSKFFWLFNTFWTISLYTYKLLYRPLRLRY